MSRPGDLYGPPIREASVRGGAGRFNWEDVKKDEKFRDTYIGHSLYAPVGRWQKGKDLQWYAKPTPTNAADEKARQKAERIAEIRKIKEAEEEALAEALGFKVERKVKSDGVSQEELARALKDEDVSGMEKVEGLGYGSVKPSIGATLPDESVVKDHPLPEASESRDSVDVDIAVKSQREGSVEREDRERRKRRHHHRRRAEEDRPRHKHRHHREHRHRSRSPERSADKDRHSDRKHDREWKSEPETRWRDYKDRDESPRRATYKERKNPERSPYDRKRAHRERSPYHRDRHCD
jgi:hypothetical protein